MNSNNRKYLNRFGMMYSKYNTQGNGVLGVRMFVLIDEYFFNDKLFDTTYRVGINVGLFKSALSSRATFEFSCYIREALQLADLFAKVIRGEQGYWLRQKTEYVTDNGNVKIPAISKIGLNKKDDNTFVIGIFYEDVNTQQIMDGFKMELDYYDVVELYNLFRNFQALSQQMIINLASNQYFANNQEQNTAEKVNNRIPSNIPQNNTLNIVDPVVNSTEDDVYDHESIFGVSVPDLSNTKIKIETTEIPSAPASDINVYNQNLKDILGGEEIPKESEENVESKNNSQEELPEVVQPEPVKEEKPNINEIRQGLGSILTEDIPEEEPVETPKVEDNVPVNTETENITKQETSKTDDDTPPWEESAKLAEGELEYSKECTNKISNLYDEKINTLINANLTVLGNCETKSLIVDLTKPQIDSFINQLIVTLEDIKHNGLTSIKITSAFKLLLLNINVIEHLKSFNYQPTFHLFDLFAAIGIIDRSPFDNTMFKKDSEEDESIIAYKNERLQQAITEQINIYETRRFKDSKYHAVIDKLKIATN